MKDAKRRIVVTGLGAVTSVGLNVGDTWAALKAGKSGISRITVFDPADCPTQIAAQVPEEFERIAKGLTSKRSLLQMTRVCTFSLAGAQEAFQDAGLDESEIDKERAAVIIGATGSGYSSVEARKRKGNYIIRSMVNSLSAWISLYYKLKGPNFTVNTACASSGYALALAYDMIKNGQADIVFAGGTESMVCVEGINGFNELLALSENNQASSKACRPFDKERDGFVMGEGAGVLILESLEHAARRGARIYGEFCGYAITSESYNILAPEKDGVGMARTMRVALANAGLGPDEVDYINAHGTSTYLNDLYETKAIKEVFEDRAYEIPISSTKSMIGHTLGAAGALEGLVTVKSIYEGIITPTINYSNPDPECDLDYVPNESRKSHLKVGISNSFGFGGHNCTLVFQRHI